MHKNLGQPRILLLDDDQILLSAMRRRLSRGYKVVTAEDPRQALKILTAESGFDVVVTDYGMPGLDGIDFLKRCRRLAPFAIPILFTGVQDSEMSLRAVDEGQVFRFLTKPCSPELLEQSISEACQHGAAARQERDLLEQTLAGSVKLLIDMVSLYDQDLGQRTARQREWARWLGSSGEHPSLWELDLAVMLSPLADSLLEESLRVRWRRGETLSSEDLGQVADATSSAARLVGNIPRLDAVAEALALQHRSYDGGGFPHPGPLGEDIPLTARYLHLIHALSDVAPDLEVGSDVLELLESRRASFDPMLWKLAQSLFADEPHTVEHCKVGHISGLRPGDRLLRDLVTEDGDLVMAADLQLSQITIARLRRFDAKRALCLPILVHRAKAKAAPPVANTLQELAGVA